MRRYSIRSFILAISVSVSGCASGPPSVFRQFNLDRGSSVAADATQRAIINTRTHPSSRPGRVNPERIVCAEPSPDVASVVANSFAFSGNIFGKGNAAVTADQAQALAQLAERTVTVQLLRDQMYRACEAYANGAISGTDYSLLMSRNNDAMVTLMLGEAASRTVGRDLAALSSSASSNASASMPVIAKAAKEAVEANEASDQADEELAAAEEKEAAAVQMAATATTDVAAVSAANNAGDAKKKTADKQKTADDAKEKAAKKNDNLLDATAGGSAAATATKGGGSFGQLSKEAVEIAESLGKMQRAYLDKGAEQHFISACIVELGKTSSEYDGYDASDGNAQLVNFTRRSLTAIQNLILKQIIVKYQLRDDDIGGISGVSSYDIDRLSRDYAAQSKAYVKKKYPDLDDAALNKHHREYAEDLFADLKVLESFGKDQTDRMLAALLPDAWEKENSRITGYFANKRRKTDRLMRAVMAFEDRERASFLANMCLKTMDDVLEREHNIHYVNDVLDFVEDTEEERASVLKKKYESKGGDLKNDTPVPPIGSAATMKATGDLVQCATDSDGDPCRKKATGAIVASLGVSSGTGNGSGSGSPILKPYAGDLSPMAAYETADLAYSKLIDVINEFEKHPLGACPESCGRCLAQGGACPDQRARGARKADAQTTACSKRCQAITAHGYDVRENELKAAIRKQQDEFQKAFGFAAKSGLAADEKNLAETNRKLAATKDEKEKADLAAKKDQLEYNLVTARNKYKDAKTAFDKTSGDISAYLKKIEDLPKD